MKTDRRLLLALGDLTAFLAFGVSGLASHEEAVSLEVVARSMLPFPLAWFVIAPWFGAFSAVAIRGELPLGRLLLIWLVVGIAALVARAVIFDRELLSAFFVIALVGNGMFLLAWRAAYGRWMAPRLAARHRATATNLSLGEAD